MKKTDSVILAPCLTGAVLATILSVSLYWMARSDQEKDNPFIPQPALSESQIKKVGLAVAEYTKKHGHRPESLITLTYEHLLSPNDLFDADRSPTPFSTRSRGQFAVTPDVIYFPALQPGDPGDCVLLCTVLLKHEDDPFLVIYNDGRFDTLSARELVAALNRTYEHIGAVCATAVKSPTTKPNNRQQVKIRDE